MKYIIIALLALSATACTAHFKCDSECGIRSSFKFIDKSEKDNGKEKMDKESNTKAWSAT